MTIYLPCVLVDNPANRERHPDAFRILPRWLESQGLPADYCKREPEEECTECGSGVLVMPASQIAAEKIDGDVEFICFPCQTAKLTDPSTVVLDGRSNPRVQIPGAIRLTD